jgi:hypothetical protein
MQYLVDQLPAQLLAVLLFALSGLAAIYGRRMRRHQPGAAADTLYATTATVSLLALMIGFTFSVALNRYETRRSLVVEEAAAIHALWQRNKLQPDAQRAAIAKALEAYVDERLRYFVDETKLDRERPSDVVADELMAEIWDLTRAAGGDGARVRLMADSLTRVDDAAWQREAVAREHIPILVIHVLIVFLLLTGFSLGYSGREDARLVRPVHMVFLAMASGAIMLLLDLDRPRSGLVLVSQQPMREIGETIAAEIADVVAPVVAPPRG